MQSVNAPSPLDCEFGGDALTTHGTLLGDGFKARLGIAQTNVTARCNQNRWLGDQANATLIDVEFVGNGSQCLLGLAFTHLCEQLVCELQPFAVGETIEHNPTRHACDLRNA